MMTKAMNKKDRIIFTSGLTCCLVLYGACCFAGEALSTEQLKQKFSRPIIRVADLDKEEIQYLRKNKDEVTEWLRDELSKISLPLYRKPGSALSHAEKRTRKLLVLLRVLDSEETRKMQKDIGDSQQKIIEQLDVPKFLNPVLSASKKRAWLSSETVRVLAAKRPEALLVRLTEKGFNALIVEELARAKVKKAILVFKKIIETEQNKEVKNITKLWLHYLGNQNIEERYKKDTPERFLKAFAKFISEQNSMVAVKESEIEFWCYPLPSNSDWGKWKHHIEKNPKERETFVKDILRVAAVLETKGRVEIARLTLRNGAEGVKIILDKKDITLLRKDVFGQWRFFLAR